MNSVSNCTEKKTVWKKTSYVDGKEEECCGEMLQFVLSVLQMQANSTS